MSADATVFEHIAVTRLPELQTAGGMFRATPRVDSVGEGAPDSSTLGAGAIVLLGLLRADEVGLAHPFSTGSLRTRVLGDLSGPEVEPGELGIALWAESRADGRAVNEIAGEIVDRTAAGFERVPLEQLAWLVSGLTEASVRVGGGSNLESLLDRAEQALNDRIVARTGFADDLHHRIGGGLTPVSGQFNCLTAFCHLERAGRGGRSAELAQNLLSALIAIQRDDGSWPGIVDPHRGEAAALYPVLTVTQVALAPIALRIAADIGLDGDLSQVSASSVGWARGRNRLGFDLVHEQEARLDRGVVPKRVPGAVSRGFTAAARRLRGRLVEPDTGDLILDPDVSSEDLGWLLEAWAGR
jgi:hypothetical protein